MRSQTQQPQIQLILLGNIWSIRGRSEIPLLSLARVLSVWSAGIFVEGVVPDQRQYKERTSVSCMDQVAGTNICHFISHFSFSIYCSPRTHNLNSKFKTKNFLNLLLFEK